MASLQLGQAQLLVLSGDIGRPPGLASDADGEARTKTKTKNDRGCPLHIDSDPTFSLQRYGSNVQAPGRPPALASPAKPNLPETAPTRAGLLQRLRQRSRSRIGGPQGSHKTIVRRAKW